MKRILLFSLIACLLLLQSCKKDNINAVKTSLTESKEKDNTNTFSVAKVLGSNMVVQRDKAFKVWGQALAGHTVTVKASWNTTTFSAISDANGNWETYIPAASATITAQNIVVKDNGGSPITLSNVLIGDVWVFSGQSNMVMPLDSVGPYPGFTGVTNRQAEIAVANYPNIRLSAILYDRETAPIDYLNNTAPWSVCTPITAKNYSAIAYYFGRKLNTTLGVPIGLVVSAVSATSCQEWVSQQTIANNSNLNAVYSGGNSSTLYNGMIYPLRKLSVKGYVWDQGEGNRHDYNMGLYTVLNSAMIGNWRSIFNQGDLPFYFVQMTPYAENFFNTTPWGDNPVAYDYAKFREIQMLVRTQTVNTGMAVTMDINEIINIHWKTKKPGGERLALLALNKTYGQTAVQCVGPQYSTFTPSGNQATIIFVSGTATGLTTAGAQPLKQYFYVAGTDSLFRQGTAVISGGGIVVTAPSGTPLPIRSVRYAFTNFPVTNLQNSADLPTEPFRTDNW